MPSVLVPLGLLCLTAFRSPALPAAEAAARPPNLLFILADDFRPDAIAALGNPHIHTPNLDRLVSRGVAFTRAYCMGSMIGAVCLPSRSMIQMGRTLFRLPPPEHLRAPYERFVAAQTNQVEGRDWVLLPRVLRAGGYQTFHVGKPGNECRPALDQYDESRRYADAGETERAESSARHADAVLEFLRRAPASRPWFIYLAPPVPHDPRVAPPEFHARYRAAALPLPARFLAVHPFDNGEMTVRDEQLAPWPRPPEVIRRHLADYYACVTCLDHHLGRIFEFLRASGQWDNTVIVFAGDNGLSLGDHGLLGKQNLYEFGGMHVPLLVAGPGIRRGRSEALVYLHDLFPTLCELARLPVPEAAEGVSLWPLLRGRSRSVRDELFTAYGQVQRALRDDRWKLIRYPLVDKTQLFDLKNDPLERNDLAGAPRHAARVQRMMTRLRRAQQQYGDPFPLVVDDPRPAAWQPPPTGTDAGSTHLKP